MTEFLLNKPNEFDLQEASSSATSNETEMCKICGAIVLCTDMKHHKYTQKYIEVENGEMKCTICKERFVNDWKHHKKSTIHKSAILQKKELKREFREQTYENYIHTLATFLALRLVLNSPKDFHLSINNYIWNSFGDIVFEFYGKGKTEAIQCKKIESKNNFPISALSAESGRMSLKKQCRIIQQLRLSTEHNNYYNNANFKLYTISNIILDENRRFTYEDKEVEITHSKNKKTDFFNTTGDSEDVFMFKLTGDDDTELKTDLNTFSMYTNQKTINELKTSITSMINDKFNPTVDISDTLIAFIQKWFEKHNLKLKRKDILLKIGELLLTPFMSCPNRVIKETNLALWDEVIYEFDVVVTKIDDDVIEKIFSGLNYIAMLQTNFTINVFDKISINKCKIENTNLHRMLLDFEGSLQSLYLSLWKAGLIPLVLKAENQRDLDLIFKMIIFLKQQNISLKCIINTDVTPIEKYCPKELKVFLHLANLKKINDTLLENILMQKIIFLNSKMPLKEICSHNKFLEMLTPDVLLNIILGDFSFMDPVLPVSKVVIDNTLVVSDRCIEEVQKYFEQKDEVTEPELSYWINVKGLPTFIQVPPKL